MHKSVGAIIKNEANQILMIDRAKFPYGWAGPAGHIDEGEKPEEALFREVKEEVNLEVLDYKLLYHEYIEWNECSRGVKGHDWYFYEIIKWKGEAVKEDMEAKEVKWMRIEDIKKIKLESVWEYWFDKYLKQ